MSCLLQLPSPHPIRVAAVEQREAAFGSCSSCRAARGCVRLRSSREFKRFGVSDKTRTQVLRLLRSRTQPRAARQLLHELECDYWDVDMPISGY